MEGQGFADISDSELVGLCLENHRPAWEEFFRRYIPLIKQTIKGKLHECGYGYLQDDQDILWDIHEKIVEKLYGRGMLRQCVNVEGLRPWLRTVAQNQTMDWVSGQQRRKRLPQRQVENSMLSLSEPLKGTAQLTLADTIPADDELDDGAGDYMAGIVAQLSENGKDKKLWALRLSLIAHLPLSAAEISDLARFRGCSENEARRLAEAMVKQVEEKEEKRITALGRAILLWHEIRRLEARFIDLKASFSETAEVERITHEIQEKTAQREKFLKDGKRFSKPPNRDIAALVGLPEDQAEQVSTLIIRARGMLRTTMGRRLPSSNSR